jgi:periplasmic divalent cation tolerance protein
MSPNASDFGVTLVTCGSVDEAEKLATGLVENRLAGCVNIVKGVESVFWWKGKVDRAQEALLIIKTQQEYFGALEKFVKAHHSYDVPEIVFLPIVQGHEPYLKWIGESLNRK